MIYSYKNNIRVSCTFLSYLATLAGMNSIMKSTGLIPTHPAQNRITVEL